MELIGKVAEEKDLGLFVDYLNHFHNPSLFDLGDSPGQLLQEIIGLARENRLYRRFEIKDKGKLREISVPNKILEKFILNYITPLINKTQVHRCCHGGVKSEEAWTPKKSLESHLPCKSALSFDLKSAFKNTSYARVYELFYNCLDFFEQEERKKFSEMLSFLCTVNYSEARGLPQGAGLSIALFNRILYPLDELLFEKCEEKSLKYSRWVDDITITSPTEIDLRYMLGAAALADRMFGLSRDKLHFQQSFPIYLLGHKIIENSVIKNSKEERTQNKVKPLDFSVFEKINYEGWV